MRIKVDAELCSGQGRCYTVSPELFQSDDEGFVVQRGTEFDVAAEDEERPLACSCPEGRSRARREGAIGRRSTSTSTDSPTSPPSSTCACATPRALDRRDWDLLASCFDDDAVVEFDGMEPITGVGALVDVCRRRPRTARRQPAPARQPPRRDRRRPRRQRVLSPRPARAERARPGRQVRRRRHVHRHLASPRGRVEDQSPAPRGRLDRRQPRRPRAELSEEDHMELKARTASRQRRVRHRGRRRQGAGDRRRPAVWRSPDDAQGRDRRRAPSSTTPTATAR